MTRASACIIFCCCLVGSFFFGVINRWYFHEKVAKDCECLTDDNVAEYIKWLDRQNFVRMAKEGTLWPLLTPGLGLKTKYAVTPPQEISEQNTALEFVPPLSNKLHWTKVSGTDTTLLSAYYDDRESLFRVPAILVLGYQSKLHRSSRLYCYFKYEDGSTRWSENASVVLEMDTCDQQKEYDRKKEREYLHVFHTCLLNSPQDEVPTHVALGYRHPHEGPVPSTTSSFIPIYKYRPTSRLDFGVCVQTPVFNKNIHDIVSFIELYKLLGVQHVTLYTRDVASSITSHLEQVYDVEFLEIIKWTDHLHEKEPIHYYGEILAIHDCLYRNMNRVKYLAFVDLDEVLAPKRYVNWREMFLEVDRPYLDSFIFVNSVYMRSRNLELNLLRNLSECAANNMVQKYFTHFDRVKCTFYYFSRSKLIVKPKLIFDLNIHGVCTRVGNTTHYFVPESSAVSRHYREIPTIECRKNRKTRRYEVTQDDWMLKYSSPLYSATNNIFCQNHFLQNHKGD